MYKPYYLYVYLSLSIILFIPLLYLPEIMFIQSLSQQLIKIGFLYYLFKNKHFLFKIFAIEFVSTMIALYAFTPLLNAFFQSHETRVVIFEASVFLGIFSEYFVYLLLIFLVISFFLQKRVSIKLALSISFMLFIAFVFVYKHYGYKIYNQTL